MYDFKDFQREFARWDDYYREKYRWEGVYSLETMVSELLVSYNADLLLRFTTEQDKVLPFDCEHCHIMVTGVSRSIYSGIYGWCSFDANTFFYGEVLPFFLKTAEETGFTGFGFIDPKVGFEQEYDRHLVFVFSPLREDADPKQLARSMTAYLQSFYEEQLFRGDKQVACFTALSRPVCGLHMMKECFVETLRLKQLSFFRMEPIVFECKDWESAYRPLDHVHLNEYCQQFSAALYSGKEEQCIDIMQRVFLEIIKHRMDFFALDYMLNFCNYVFFNTCTIYRLPLGKNMARRDYFNIEQCCEALCRETRRILQGIRGTGTHLSYLSREALCYIHAHYNEPISLKDIAEAIHVGSSYLSRVFRQETGNCIVQYINALRMERARELLVCTDDKVKDIAADIGIPNVKYMLRLFKEHTGLSPQEYRTQYKS